MCKLGQYRCCRRQSRRVKSLFGGVNGQRSQQRLLVDQKRKEPHENTRETPQPARLNFPNLWWLLSIIVYAFSRTAPRKRGSFRSSRSQASRTSGAFCPSRQKNVVSSQYA